MQSVLFGQQENRGFHREGCQYPLCRLNISSSCQGRILCYQDFSAFCPSSPQPENSMIFQSIPIPPLPELQSKGSQSMSQPPAVNLMSGMTQKLPEKIKLSSEIHSMSYHLVFLSPALPGQALNDPCQEAPREHMSSKPQDH